ncbi:luciferin 4-monooxygenase-like isoform X8 [Nymphalis io]|uniref:luciferin 4-monooxygenase-like isoform X3 n=1 Tax=Inachis io TaxID=171585 RepID=UPI0021691788|nr:luciferin 4-monooxygenase-like isoform X3 [Nymphalis io]XP_050353155.1 luciferin 4-monooxygenase-like isoform X4 [Nymphalis io]XP_050353156.1 luciferin 4-monooxygenase-like isoform X5 [Nymphalis io]XP_050353157.1 luciferin 4-monooxygenase-like isoform X6 [Nymphalis io]XP_050353158.1 luciferin 4-monooxygenase-like isoform X7 [Nymphalis io]XP_050353159.1 luciferin 4-monooxygenase-like isoform X8 [Nymphalis io]
MAPWQHRTDAVHWYMQELSSRVVAASGIPSDRHHLGKLTLQGFKDAPDFVLQIDGATNETETFGSALKRSVQCATAFRNLGLKHGDVIVLMAPNHIHLTVPMYAAFYLGISVAGIDMTLRHNELRETFKCINPKMIFCQSESVNDIRSVIEELKFDTKIITFDKNDRCMNFSDLLEKYGSDVSVKDFKAADFDPAKTISLLIATSGTTGLPKSAAITHKNMAVSVPYMWLTYSKFPTPTRLTVVFSPIEWYSALFQFVFSPIIRHSRLQSSAPMTQEHAYYLINKFRPTFAMTSPNMLTTFLKIGDRNKCDFTCFETILVGGSSVHTSLIEDIKKVSPNTNVVVIYGMSEISGIAFNFDPTIPNSLGKPIQSLEHKLVNPATHKDITEPDVPGELWVRGPGVFQGYYNNPEVTSQVVMKGGWLKTGDMMYKDNMSNFYFVERIKLLLKYRSYQISPLEIESVIAEHPRVFEVAVTGIPHKEDGDLPVACIVPHEGYKITAQEIKDLVRDSLSDSKQLRGGVIFLKELPLTSTSKIDRPKLAALARSMERE